MRMFPISNAMCIKYLEYISYGHKMLSKLNCIQNSWCKFSSRVRLCSSLYVSHSRCDVTAVVDVDLELEKLIHLEKDVTTNLLKRQMKFDFSKLIVCYHKLEELKVEKIKLESLKKNLNQKIQLESNESQQKYLIEKVRAVKVQLKPVVKKYKQLEEELMIAALKLPNMANPDASIDDKILAESGSCSKPSFTVRHHDELGQSQKLLYFSPGAEDGCYLLGNLALLEYDLIQSISDYVRRRNFYHLSCPDMMKTVVLEGCGRNFKNKDEVLTLQPRLGEMEDLLGFGALEEQSIDKIKIDRLFYLCGISVESFCAYLTRMSISSSSLPWHGFIAGRSYHPVQTNSNTGLLNLNQRTTLNCMSVVSTDEQCNKMFEWHKNLLWQFYSQLDFLHLRLVDKGVPNLSFIESSRIDIEAWLPTENSFIQIGSVSKLGDFVSRRLMVRLSESVSDTASKQFVHMVFSNFVNVPNFLAVLIQNCQTETGQFVLPEKLISVLGSEITRNLLLTSKCT